MVGIASTNIGGYSADKNKIIFVLLMDVVFLSVTTKQLAYLMRSAGAYTAFNMDGGGSSTMYIKEFGAINDYSDPYERSIANGLFVVSSAPQSNTIASIQPYNPNIYIHPVNQLYPLLLLMMNMETS